MIKWAAAVAALLCLTFAIFESHGKELTLDDIFPTDRVIDVQITVSQENWDTIRYQGRDFREALGESRKFQPPERPYTYVDASVTIDGVHFPEIGLRKKGFIGSQSHTRPSLKIKLNHVDKAGSIDGLTNLTLNNNKQDTSLMSQFMGYALFNASGVPAPRCAYARVTVNGKNLGIYAHVESIRNPLLERAFGNSDGALFEGTVVDFYEDWENSFEYKRGGDEEQGRAHINALIDTLANRNATEADIGKLIDLESFYRFWAIEGLVGFWDGYSGNKNNFFVYLNPEDDKFYFIPWGMDSIFTKLSKLEFMNDRRAPISVKTQGLIAHHLYQLDIGRERYREALTDILEKHWNVPELLATLDAAAALAKPHLVDAQRVIEEEWDRNRWGNPKKPTFESELETVRDFIRNREGDVRAEIAEGMPVWRKRPEPPFLIPEEGDFMAGFLKRIENTLAGAARTGNLEAIKEHIEAGADVNQVQFEMPPLAWAALAGETEAVELLLEHGADVDSSNGDGNTALMLAVFLGHAETTELLLNRGANVYARNHDGATPLDTVNVPWGMTQMLAKPMGIELEPGAFEAGRAKIRELFIALASTEKDDGDAHGFWAAARTGNMAEIKAYLDGGGDINGLDKALQTSALEWGALHGQIDVVRFLLEKGADVNRSSKDGSTALHGAAFLGKPEIVKLLLKHGADTQLRTKDGLTPADALYLERETTAFVAGFVGVEVGDAEFAAIKAGRNAVAKLLGVEGALDARYTNPQNLATAALTGNLDAVKRGLTAGADANTKDPNSGTPLLILAAVMGHTNVVELLLEHGADIHGKGADSGTALHAAAFFGRVETVKYLLEKGADTSRRNNSGGTALAGAQLPWPIAKGIIAMLQIEVDEAEVTAGRAEVVKILSRHRQK